MTKDEALKMALEALEVLAHFASDESDDGQMAIGAYEALRQAIEQSENQEPVMWMDAKDFALLYTDGTIDCNTKPHQENPDDVPLYTAPQRQWVSLSDDDYEELSKMARVEVIEIIEALLRRKNHATNRVGG